MVKKPKRREVKLVHKWRANQITMPELANKLKISKTGAYSTIARVYKHEYYKDE